MTEVFTQLLREQQQQINDKLLSITTSLHSPGNPNDAAMQKLAEAIGYSLGNGGKRVRPLLSCFAAQAVGSRADDPLLSVACAVELIHTYSLLHDDLPAMDDDDMRRGRPSLHKAYDEATAILVGDGLQALAFSLIAESDGFSGQQKSEMVRVLASASGPNGMVGGQFVDIQVTDTDLDLSSLQGMHSLKTGAMIRAALAIGGIAGEATVTQLEALDRYADAIGLAFQVVDDILDIEGDPAAMGKTGGKDAEANKPTYVKLLGLDGAKTEAAKLLDTALQALTAFDESANALRDMARYIVARDR